MIKITTNSTINKIKTIIAERVSKIFKRELLAGAVLAMTTTSSFANGGSIAPVPTNHWGSFYLGGELTGTHNRPSEIDLYATIKAGYAMAFQNHLTLAAETFASSTRTVGFSVLPGIALSDKTNLYGRLGVVNSRVPLGADDSFAFNRTGIQLGVGVSRMLTRHLAINAEYNWERYGNVSYNYTYPTSSDLIGPPRVFVSGHPIVHKVGLGVTWYFHPKW